MTKAVDKIPLEDVKKLIELPDYLPNFWRKKEYREWLNLALEEILKKYDK